MTRSFDTDGPCIPGEHYMLPPDLRKEIAWADKQLVREVEHAARKIRIVGC